ncbi:hypothetical protein [Sphingomonas sp. HMP6]|uniref:hypothetical protein n=1 Tax=Sphingomonas sp. HMP6 TaxID=1517551 RepID=UPI00159692A6|nr:hypothetical protein [Sphingomonas sp. HMP6]BCA60740.1 hypothetical protein HMP06_3509 [Sphingomonas sp. HMP6]
MSPTPPTIFPASWQPRSAAGLVRVGPDEDGGYVIGAAALARTKRLVSGGLFDDWRFEADFQARTGSEIDCYDASVTAKFWAKRYYAYAKAIPAGRTKPRDFARYLEFKRFFDGRRNRHHRAFLTYGTWGTDLHTAIGTDAGASTFLKIDIEVSEYRVLPDIIARQEAVSGFVIEFHDVDLHVDRISRFIADAAPWFYVEHLHINNYGPLAPNGLPTAIEMSFGRVDQLLPTDEAVVRSYPLTGLDVPNNPDAADIAFTFA